MKKYLLICFLLIMTLPSFSQGNLPEGGKRVNAGFGFSNFGTPVYVGVDFGITEDITIGPQISYRNYSQRFLGVRFRQDLILIGVNGDYHFNTLLDLPSEFDVYAGLHLGYFIWSDDDDTPGNDFENSGFGASIHVGGRYFFTNEWALNVELGGGTASGGKIGVSFQF